MRTPAVGDARRTEGARPLPPEEPVYPVREDSELLASVVDARPGLRVLEACCGSGPAARRAAAQGAFVVAADRNPHALRSVRRGGAGIALVRTDLLDGLTRFDRIYANPPYLPTPPGLEDPDPWHHLALDGGPTGLAVTERLLEALPDHLVPSGAAFLLFSSLQDAGEVDRLLARWRRRGGTWSVAAERTLPDGERLRVIRFSPPRRAVRRGKGSRRRTGPRRRARPAARRTGSSRGGGSGRTRARDGA
jgi:release factor glutamine methyltransferase